MGGGDAIGRAAVLALQGHGAADGAWPHVAGGGERQGVNPGSAGSASVDEGEVETGSEGDPVAADAQVPVMTEIEGAAIDPGVPRYRPHVMLAESALDGPGAMRRAVWQAKYNAARGTQARVIVPGWRQSDGSLWQINHLVAVRVPFLSLDMELLIAGVSYGLNAMRGRHTGTDPRPGRRLPAGSRPSEAASQPRRQLQESPPGRRRGFRWNGVAFAGLGGSYSL